MKALIKVEIDFGRIYEICRIYKIILFVLQIL